MNERALPKCHAALRTDIEHGAKVRGRTAPVLDALGAFAPKKLKAECRFDVSRFIHKDVFRNRPGKPVPRKCAPGSHSTLPITCAGLPMTRARGGTSRVTSDPGSMNAPRPIRT